MKALVVSTCICLLAGAAVGARADDDCGDLRNHFGPFDYRTAQRKQIEIVEMNHFTRRVETLEGGQSSSRIGSDIAYTLMVFPNHPRALLAMAALADQTKARKPVGSQYTVECWFERAIRFQPDDGVVQLIYGISLLRQGQLRPAIGRLESALALLGDNANAFYNLGLAYFEAGDFDAALGYAHKAYAAGFPLPGLRNKLQAAGKWREPEPS